MTAAEATKTLGVKDLKEFFGYTKLADFSRDWKLLSEESKEQIRTGISDGTFNY
jgi:hypothetical protein